MTSNRIRSPDALCGADVDDEVEVEVDVVLGLKIANGLVIGCCRTRVGASAE